MRQNVVMVKCDTCGAKANEQAHMYTNGFAFIAVKDSFGRSLDACSLKCLAEVVKKIPERSLRYGEKHSESEKNDVLLG